MSRLIRTLLTVALVLAWAGTSTRAQTTTDDLCTGDPCQVSGSIVVDGGSALDFGARSLVLQSNAHVTVGPIPAGAPPETEHSLSLTAASISMEAGAKIDGSESDGIAIYLTSTTGDVTMASSGGDESEIVADANDSFGGSIEIQSAQNANLDGLLSASASGTDATGGEITIHAGGDVTLDGEVSTEATGRDSGAGGLTIRADGSVTLREEISLKGGAYDGGGLDITTVNGGVTIAEFIDTSGSGLDGSGGDILIDSAGDIWLTADGEFKGKAGSGADDDCGDGSLMEMRASGSIWIDGKIDIGGGSQCYGGDFDFITSEDFIQGADAVITNSTGGGDGGGGWFTLSASRAVELYAVSVSGSGGGGEIAVTAGTSIDVLGKLNARATGSFGFPGGVSLTGCSVDVLAPKGELDSRGDFAFAEAGSNIIRVSGSATISGDMRAVEDNFGGDGKNLIFYVANPPSVTGKIEPAETLIGPGVWSCAGGIEIGEICNPTDIGACGASPGLCQDVSAGLLPCANSCGDGNPQDPEVCDDGNLASCDGCSSDCSRVDSVCGDGIHECGEQCDDGNLTNGDGCESNCTPSGQSNDGVFIESKGKKVGCQVQWRAQIENPTTDKLGKPSAKQECVDGDFACDADGEINDSCSFIMAPCANVPDPDLPECDYTETVAEITLKKPLHTSNKPEDAANGNAVLQSLLALGTTLIADGDTVQTGSPVAGETTCGPDLEVTVPFSGKSGKKTFKVRSENTAGRKMKSGQVQFTCQRNDAICGNGDIEPNELCDDGNADSCDGCTNCRPEFCGNGVVECDEQCDEGVLNGAPESRCSAECTIEAPELRIRGGGSKKTDCMMQWSMDIDENKVIRDKKGFLRNKQFCMDNDPACDLDPAVGNCKLQVFACFGAANEDISCLGQAVNEVDVRRPKANSRKAFEAAAHHRINEGLASVAFPVVAETEQCSGVMAIDLPKGESLRLSLKAIGAKKDGDAMRVSCE